MTKRFNAFTLAEVLITLGIIGVVAAMTMPTLMNQTNGAQYKAAYKKALSAISQAVTLNVALDDVSFADTVTGTAGSTNAPSSSTTSIASLLNSRMNVVKATTESAKGWDIARGANTSDTKAAAPGSKGENTTLFFNDGSTFTFQNADAGCSFGVEGSGVNKVCKGYIDVNGSKGPNKVVSCDNDTSDDSCTVSNPTDVYPVMFYDQTILPHSPAARAVLYGK
jgi:prepilin-type N-terminal cleavage/methylation domain-containing protein